MPPRNDAPRVDWYYTKLQTDDRYEHWVSADGVQISLATEAPATARVLFHPEREVVVYADNARHRVGQVTIKVSPSKIVIKKTFRNEWRDGVVETVADDKVAVTRRMARSVAHFVETYPVGGAAQRSVQLLRKLRHSRRVVIQH